jgi:hypothetical protein
MPDYQSPLTVAICRNTMRYYARAWPPVASKRQMKRALLVIIVVALYILHQDVWFWRTASPLVFGFLPIGLFYHACYTLAVSACMWALVRYAWPSHLESEVEGGSRKAQVGPPAGEESKLEEGQAR